MEGRALQEGFPSRERGRVAASWGPSKHEGEVWGHTPSMATRAGTQRQPGSHSLWDRGSRGPLPVERCAGAFQPGKATFHGGRATLYWSKASRPLEQKGGQEVFTSPRSPEKVPPLGGKDSPLACHPRTAPPQELKMGGESLPLRLSSNANTLTLTAWWEMDPLCYQTAWRSLLLEPTFP